MSLVYSLLFFLNSDDVIFMIGRLRSLDKKWSMFWYRRT